MNKPVTYSVKIEVEHGLSDVELTPEKQVELFFMNDYLCLSAILWAIHNLNYKYKDAERPLEMFEHCEYLALIGQSFLHDMSSRIQRQYFLKGGQSDAGK